MVVGDGDLCELVPPVDWLVECVTLSRLGSSISRAYLSRYFLLMIRLVPSISCPGQGELMGGSGALTEEKRTMGRS